MPDLTVKLSVQIPGGPTVQGGSTVPVASYQTLEWTLPPNASGTAKIDVDFTVDDKEAINLLLIQSTLYSNPNEDAIITYTIKDKITDLPFEEPLFLLGSKLIEAIAQPTQVTFKNLYKWTDGKDDTLNKNTAKVTVLVGRAAPPPPKTETPEAAEPAEATTPPAAAVAG
ncbi:hypothetical protein H6F90_10670 [Trichocoleus sp. FACHB-591]|uniref:hypothetical protein n=1 Tax=Trichocoleus sp. FACHB-591 TaxID=2692872 RepID=UPI00168600C8|nr:hypothetical protein [Trichocoleus sp. FACHB-591]MBD2095617.1 hypothetical protein [Trichocoleus sp. FACHB-591]